MQLPDVELHEQKMQEVQRDRKWTSTVSAEHVMKLAVEAAELPSNVLKQGLAEQPDWFS